MYENKTIKIPLSTNNHLGTKKHPYKINHKQKRRVALTHRVKELIRHGLNTRRAVIRLRKRLNVLRIFNKHLHKKICQEYQDDMKWLNSLYQLNLQTRDICK